MQIHGPHGPHGLGPIFPQRGVEGAEAARAAGLEFPRDEIEISAEARMLDEISRSGEVQQSRVDEIRRMIASGVYETPERLAVALDRLIDDLHGNGGVSKPTDL
jgi:anti-sigma28 factor (negative regulator of flagellin synthesis)